MKKTNKLLAMFLVLSLVFSFLCLPISAAVPAAQGKTAVVTFTFEDVAGVNGSISYSNKAIFASITPTVLSNTEGEASESAFYIYRDNATEGTISFVLKLKLGAKAKVNDTCMITLTYDEYDDQGNIIRADVVKTETVKVLEADAIDLSELEYQIALAKSLNKKDFTPDTWAVLVNALAAAEATRGSSSQSRVDGAAKTLEEARLALVALDYSDLEAALKAAEEFFNTDDVTALMKQLMDAVVSGQAYLNNGAEQVTLDATATQILELIAALKEALNKVGVTETVEVPVEVVTEVITEVEVVTEVTTQVVSEKVVEVEVQNNLFFILFIITLIILVVLIVLAVLYFIKKKNTETDTTPLVDYRIEDDDN